MADTNRRLTISELADAMTVDSGPTPEEFGRALAGLAGTPPRPARRIGDACREDDDD